MIAPVIIIGGIRVIEYLDSEYVRKHGQWECECAAVHTEFKQKTSRTRKNGKEYESTSWYRINPDGSLKSIGKEAPDFKKYYPPEPKPPYSFEAFKTRDGHIIIEQKDYQENQNLFEDCLVFSLPSCMNQTHPLYKNTEKALKDSVRHIRSSWAGSGITRRTENSVPVLVSRPRIREDRNDSVTENHPDCEPSGQGRPFSEY